jgi:post-segregation antitoxin (ccd killing protein)
MDRIQVNVTILRWLQLLPGQHLELEAGEDIDLIQDAAAKGLDGAQLFEQVKRLRRKRLTLWSADALEAIANFCQHCSSRPREKLSLALPP